ncbi:hypothetical protein THMIRHAM_03770 [Thiomicrorhabdus immobilis]|uniref:DUF2927 domain-containing protein n=1 Tax=Thiomicrorhabdus immobilis TaxID=2791037 RepID=A0ABM7MB55_9GAMM|nr:DUF2927 domain-containing protein [Thiomicrorhabdus immobilis]BCN92592.1 hypothetical protein THMIRHAM_03770 [Thiomicrorhabdus immobilis]
MNKTNKSFAQQPFVFALLRFFSLFSVIAVASLPSVALAQHTTDLNLDLNWQNPAYIQKAFNEIALKNEYQKTDQRIIKWLQPIHYRFEYHHVKTNPMVENLFNTHLRHLSEITQHPIFPTEDTPPNLIIHLTADNEYAQVIKRFTASKVANIERDSNCMGSFKTNRHNEIVEAQIILPLDHVFSRGLLVACVVEETTQIMGLPNDSDWVNPSIANDASKVELLTGLDYILLKILYDKQLHAGMAFEQSQPIIRKRISALKDADEIKNANHQVNKSGLYPLVN